MTGVALFTVKVTVARRLCHQVEDAPRVISRHIVSAATRGTGRLLNVTEVLAGTADLRRRPCFQDPGLRAAVTTQI